MCSSVRQWIGYRGRPLNLQRLIVVAYHRTTGVPGQGVNGRLLYLVINRAGQGPTSGGLSMIERRLRHNVLGRANPRVLPTMDRSTRHARKPDWSVITADLLPGPPREGWRNVVNPGVFEGSAVPHPAGEKTLTPTAPHSPAAPEVMSLTARPTLIADWLR
jgi:hypothetical protein